MKIILPVAGKGERMRPYTCIMWDNEETGYSHFENQIIASCKGKLAKTMPKEGLTPLLAGVCPYLQFPFQFVFLFQLVEMLHIQVPLGVPFLRGNMP